MHIMLNRDTETNIPNCGRSLITAKLKGKNSITYFENVTMRCSVNIVTVTMRYF